MVMSLRYQSIQSNSLSLAQGGQRADYENETSAGVDASIEAKQLLERHPDRLEYGGEIYKYTDADGNIRYGYTVPRVGRAPTPEEYARGIRGVFQPNTSAASNPLVPDSAEVVAIYHSHPSSTSFSPADLNFPKNRDINIYVGRGGFQGGKLRVKVDGAFWESGNNYNQTPIYDTKKGYVGPFSHFNN